jgi:hypothetical protein
MQNSQSTEQQQPEVSSECTLSNGLGKRNSHLLNFVEEFDVGSMPRTDQGKLLLGLRSRSKIKPKYILSTAMNCKKTVQME